MITSLFSVFDPSIYYILSPWFISLFILFFFYSYWFCSSYYGDVLGHFYNSVSSEFFSVLGPSIKKLGLVFVYSSFFFIFLLNFIALFPSFFTVTGHLLFRLGISIVYWSFLIYFSLVNNSYSFFSHIVPIGTPVVLIPFMVLVEFVSNIIRPITLCVRLVANIVAGHLLMGLLGNFLISSGFFLLFFGFFSGFILLILELAVSFIQGYVFLTLFSLYSGECH